MSSNGYLVLPKGRKLLYMINRAVKVNKAVKGREEEFRKDI
jgi:hypothetical protein